MNRPKGLLPSLGLFAAPGNVGFGPVGPSSGLGSPLGSSLDSACPLRVSLQCGFRAAARERGEEDELSGLQRWQGALAEACVLPCPFSLSVPACAAVASGLQQATFPRTGYFCTGPSHASPNGSARPSRPRSCCGWSEPLRRITTW